MEIQSTQYAQQIQNVQGVRGLNKAAPSGIQSAETQPSQQITAGKDEAKFSDAALKLSDALKVEESAPVRFDLVNRIKKEISAGTYETADKMDIALDRLLSRLNPS
ncbi:hypothetical protein FACS18942_08780 [Planctomycetales bacterium]|nr:hypothetical protein FACS18942_08780 [Planctomycetales bacterium]